MVLLLCDAAFLFDFVAMFSNKSSSPQLYTIIIIIIIVNISLSSSSHVSSSGQPHVSFVNLMLNLKWLSLSLHYDDCLQLVVPQWWCFMLLLTTKTARGTYRGEFARPTDHHTTDSEAEPATAAQCYNNEQCVSSIQTHTHTYWYVQKYHYRHTSSSFNQTTCGNTRKIKRNSHSARNSSLTRAITFHTHTYTLHTQHHFQLFCVYSTFAVLEWQCVISRRFLCISMRKWRRRILGPA